MRQLILNQGIVEATNRKLVNTTSVSASTYSISNSDVIINYVGTSPATLTLPAIGEQMFLIRNESNFLLTVAGQLGDLINGEESIILKNKYTSIFIASLGTSWGLF